jgi:Ion channel
MVPEMEHQEFWQKIESSLRKYEQTYATAQWFRHWGGLTQSRRGHFLFLRFIFLVALYVAAYYLPLYLWAKIGLTMIAGYSIADMYLAPTALIFGGFPFMKPLRGLVFLFFNYISICISFGILYVTLCRSSFNIVPDFIDLAYFSFTTMTALGMGDITPARHTILVKFLVVSEILIGLYFWAVLVGMIIAWAVREAKGDSSSPK